MLKNSTDVSMKDSKRVLLVYHINFLDRDSGVNMHTYEIVNALKNKGYSIDFFTTDYLGDFSKFHSQNKTANIVDNLYCASYRGNSQNKSLPYKSFTWINDYILQEFQNVLKNNHYDYIYVHYIQWMDLVKFSTIPANAKVIYTMHDMNFIQAYYNKADYLSDFADELELLEYADEVTCISYDEMYFFKKFLPDLKYTHLPHFLPITKLNDAIKDIDVLLLAFSNSYNFGGLKWFVDNVCPYLNKNIKITICGRIWRDIDNDQELSEKIKLYNILRIDFAESLDELYSRVKLSIVPMFQGTGLKIKTIDSLARGIPVVATLLGVDGFPDKKSNGCLVSDDPYEFASHINKMLTDEEFYSKTRSAANQYFKDTFSDVINLSKLDNIFSLRNFNKIVRIGVESINPCELDLNDNSDAAQLPVVNITSIAPESYNNFEKVRQIRLLGVPVLKISKSYGIKRIYLFNFIQIFKRTTIR